jgi:aryl-alcohol dehydrogenase-like predicted oxidoreductase
METITFGRTDLKVSRIAFGTWQLGGEWGRFDEQTAIDAIHEARARGINFFDTAQAYGFGRSEQLLGQALADELQSNRQSLVIATKGGLRMVGNDVVRDSSPAWLRQGVENSLVALGVDYIDLYQVHWPDRNTPFEVTAQALQELVEEGKIRHVGVSNFNVAQMEAFSRVRPVESLQPPYHMFHRDIEHEILPWTAAHDVGVLIYGPLAHGLLTGTIGVDATFPEGDWRGESSDFRGDTLRRNVAVVDRLKTFAAQRNLDLSQLATAWTLAHPAVHVAIVGARKADHIAAAVEAAAIYLDKADLVEIDRILVDSVSMVGPSPEGS